MNDSSVVTFGKVVRSFLFSIALIADTTVMCFLMIWVLPLPRSFVLKVVHLWLRQVAWIERHIGGIYYRVIGTANIPAGACIIAAKHQSVWETFKLHLLFDDPAIVLKKELLNVPFWGWYLRRSGMIPIDRSGRTQALANMIPAARRAVSAGRKIVIFPQGTRISAGEVRPYKSGVAGLYQELQIPIIPMALNSGIFWPKHRFIKTPGIITVEFLSPIMPGLTREEVMRELRDRLEAASEQLAKNA